MIDSLKYGINEVLSECEQKNFIRDQISKWRELNGGSFDKGSES